MSCGRGRYDASCLLRHFLLLHLTLPLLVRSATMSTHHRPPDDLLMPHIGNSSPSGLGVKSNRLSNGVVAGPVVGASVMFSLIGFACFGLLHAKKEAKPKVEMVRPHEWSIETTSPTHSKALVSKL
eukprot:Gb_19954 [translate_table: standard]